jgi:hypothetical protein
MASTAFDTLIKTRLRVPSTQLPQDYFTISRVESDAVLMKAIGYGAPKLYLTQTPVLVENFEQVRQIVAAADTLYENPVIHVSYGAQRENCHTHNPHYFRRYDLFSEFARSTYSEY